MKVKVHVTLKNGVLDPQGNAIAAALTNMGFNNIEEIKQGKYFEINLATSDINQAKEQAVAMCEALLARVVIENYTIDIE